MNRDEFIARWMIARRAAGPGTIEEGAWSYRIEEANRAWKAYQEALQRAKIMDN